MVQITIKNFFHSTHTDTHTATTVQTSCTTSKKGQHSCWVAPERKFIVWGAKTYRNCVIGKQNFCNTLHKCDFFFFPFSLSCIPFCLICPANLIHSERTRLRSSWSSPGKTRQLCHHRSSPWPVKDFPCCQLLVYTHSMSMQSKTTWFRLKDANILQLLSHTQPPLYQDIKGILCWFGCCTSPHNKTQHNIILRPVRYMRRCCVLYEPKVAWQRRAQWLTFNVLASDLDNWPVRIQPLLLFLH